MEAYELMAAHAASIELAVDSYYEPDGGIVSEYAGPQLLVVARYCRIITITHEGRQRIDVDPRHMNTLVDLALAACKEPQPAMGPDTAVGRPITRFRLRAYRALHELSRDREHAINHYGPRALRPNFSAFLVALRDASSKLPRAANTAWDLAGQWMAPRDLGALWHTGQPVPLPSIINVLAHDDTVYFRAGQPPHRSELYRLDAANQLVWLRDNQPPAPVTPFESEWTLPCGAGLIGVRQEWQQTRRIYVRIDDPARGIYVQRE